MSRWGGGPPAMTVDPRLLIDTIEQLRWCTVGAALDTEADNSTILADLPFAGVAVDAEAREAGGHLTAWTMRVQVWDKNPTPTFELTRRLNTALTEGLVTFPDGIVGVRPGLLYPPVTDPRTDLQVGSFTITLLARHTVPVTV